MKKQTAKPKKKIQHVFVVTQHDHCEGEQEVVAVFSSRAEAEKYVKDNVPKDEFDDVEFEIELHGMEIAA